MNFYINLCDINPKVVAAMQKEFAWAPKLVITNGDALQQEVDALICPTNSFGFLEIGFANAVRSHYTANIEIALRQFIEEKHRGDMPIGYAYIYEAPKANQARPLRYVVFAPVARAPGIDISNTLNTYYAFMAALLAIEAHNQAASERYQLIESVAAPAMGAGYSKMPADRAARQMKAALDWVNGPEKFKSSRDATAHTRRLLR